MSAKTIKITYWILTALLAMAMAGDGFGGVTRQQAGIDVLKHLGYPIYFMVIMGTAKLLGVIAILQNKYKAVKEWAFAGFSFTFFGAIASRAFVGDSTGELIPPIVMLAFLFTTYYFWKKYNQLKSTE
ncbi:DoxX family protein [Mucilaginibacter ginsenosidivorax]|uniref:DoxX family protein n=1 Tax=Mucilaginibacter ginsenosidivorax TaxID=862126 RepID=A0A5B8VSS7_9SPHI|nr:DoxX family protein [Mucilaginibacter ginsenosidivorax]QEC74499.1 DoxX family protein [Mucilaginibacter ginsenosidivorax]